MSVDTNRCAFTAQYCQPWVRQQENMMLSDMDGEVGDGGFWWMVEPLVSLRCNVYTSNLC